MSEKENLEAGIAAIKSGNMPRAASLFAQVVKENPTSEQGWFLLGMSCATTEQREYCLQRVLALNPNNSEARKQLGLIKPPPISPTSKPFVPAPVTNIPKPAPPVESHVSPFIEDTRESFQDDNPVFLSDEKSVPQGVEAEKRKPKKQKLNLPLLFAVVGIPIFLICGVGIAYFLITGPTAPLTSPDVPVLIPSASPTSTPLAIATATSTLAPPTGIPSPLPTVAYTPRFEDASCSFDTPKGADVKCGYVIVPEDRTGDPSHTIRLAVAVFHSTSSSPASDPVMFLQGGPGAEAVKLSAGAYDYLVAPFLSDRDFITYDQRGTGLSEPALKCEELSKIYTQDIHGLIPSTTRKLVYSSAFLSCKAFLTAQGIDVNAYTSAANAADLKDVLNVLGYKKADLYGASYGTRLALVVMRDYPEIVQSAILDSVVPVNGNLFLHYSDSANSGLRALFDTCAAEPKCNAAYPNLETVFKDLVTQLDAKPVTVTTSTYPAGTVTEAVNGSTLTSVVLGSVKSSSLINTAPQTIYRIKNGDYSTLIAAQYSLPYALEDINPGLYISVMCHEHIFATTLEELQSISIDKSMKDYAWLPFYGDANDLFHACKSWGAVPPAYGEDDAVISDIPTLVITGKYDPTTPPIFARQVASTLSHSYYFEFPDQGHTPTAADTSGCAMDTATAFLNNPSVEPDRTCLNNLGQVDFLVPYTGDPSVTLDTQDVSGISVEAPKNWRYQDHFFARTSSPLDITQIGILQTNRSAAELKDWFSQGAYGYRGLDNAPVKAGQRKAWTLYTSTSDGRPVDIAIEDQGDTSLVVMMFCNSDERDALYKTVFLPMVDSAQ